MRNGDSFGKRVEKPQKQAWLLTQDYIEQNSKNNLKVIFPEISEDEWTHDKVVPGFKSQSHPDYQCESLKLIVEFDSLQHYQKPDIIRADEKKSKIHEE